MKPFHAHFILLMCATLVTAAVGILYFYMFNQVDISANRALSAARTARIEQLSEVEQKNTIQKFEDTKEDRARLYSYIIPADAAVSFVESLEKLGTESGASVQIDSVMNDDAGAVKGGGPSQPSIKGHVVATGPWQNVMTTLMLAENLPYQSKISGVQFNQTDSDLKTGKKWSMSFYVTTPLVDVNKLK